MPILNPNLHHTNFYIMTFPSCSLSLSRSRSLCGYSVYSGHQSILIPPMELEGSPPLWLSTLSQYKIRDTFCSYSVMELCTKSLGTQTELLKVNTHAYFKHVQYHTCCHTYLAA